MPSPPLPELEPECHELLAVFWELSRMRTGGLGGPEAMQPTMVFHYLLLVGKYLPKDETAIIFRMDTAYLGAWYRIQKAKEEARDLGEETPKDRPYK